MVKAPRLPHSYDLGIDEDEDFGFDYHNLDISLYLDDENELVEGQMNGEKDDKMDDDQKDEDVNEMCMDYTSVFTTMEYFASRDTLVQWVRRVGNEHNIVIVVKRSDNGMGKKKPTILLACERGGVYRDTTKGKGKQLVLADESKIEGVKPIKRRTTGTKKCGCPFLLKGKQITDSEWALEVKCGTHNHPIAIHLEGHSFTGRISTEEEQFVINLSKCNAPPKFVLQELKKRHEANHSTIRYIYNARKKHKMTQFVGRSQLQYLMSQLVDKKYIHYSRSCNKTNTIQDLYFSHLVSVELVHAFPKVLIINCTYKTNRYRLPFMEVVGVTSTGMTFSVASVYLSAEKEDNYAWALGVLRIVLGERSLPTVIVTDREKALMNAIANKYV